MEAGALISELKRRRVFRVLVGYGIVAFAVLQVIEPLMHALHLADATLTYTVVVLAMGFPVAVVLAWAFDVNEGRIERSAPAASASLRGTSLRLMLIAIGVLAAAPGVIWYFVWPGHSRVRTGAPSASTGSAGPPSIAVLPFADMSPAKDQEYFSDGIAEQILDNLAQVDGLKVIGRTSSFSFKGKSEDLRAIGEKLGVAHVLEGSVRKDGSHIRITAQLIAAADGSHIWSRSFDRQMTGVFAVQDEIARAVVDALKGKLLLASTPRVRSTENVEAFEHYLLGKHFDQSPGIPDAYLRAKEQFEKATALDPRFGAAWAGLAFALKDAANNASTTHDVLDFQRRSLAAARKAVESSPDSAEALSTRGLLRWWLAADRDGAHADLERALELNPNDSSAHRRFGMLLATEGRLSQGIAEVRRGIELDPLNPNIWIRIAYFYVVDGEPELARQAVARTMEIAPAFHDAEGALVVLDVVEGKPASALARCARLADESSRLWCTGVAQAAAGQKTLAKETLELLARKQSFLDPGDPSGIAEIHALLRENERAFEWLGRLAVLHGESAAQVKIDPLLRNLHADARWPALLKRLNLPLD